MTRVEFIEGVKKYNQKKDKHIKILIVAALCFVALGLAGNNVHISSILYTFGAVCFGSFLNYKGNSDEAHMLKVAVKLLSQRENT